jgi:hypothetical protein
MRHLKDDERLVIREVGHKNDLVLQSIEWVSDDLLVRDECSDLIVGSDLVIPYELLGQCLCNLILRQWFEKVFCSELNQFRAQP